MRAFRKAVLSGEHDAVATVIVAILADHFGDLEWFGWEPDILVEEIKDDFGITMPDEVRDKLWALVTALTTDLFYTDAIFFNHVANALGSGPTNMEDFEPATLEEMAWAVLEVGMNDLEDDEEPPFSPDLQIYVGALLKHEGLGPVPPLDWADTETPGFQAADSATAAMQVQDRDRKRQELKEHLRERTLGLHQDLRSAGVAPSPARRGASQRD